MDVEERPVNDIELNAIEEHLVKVYVGCLNDVFSKGVRVKGEFESFVKRPLYLVALEYCEGNKLEVKDILGVGRATLDVKLDKYFAAGVVSKLELADPEKRLYMLYGSYLEQILADGITSKFVEIVDRAMYRAVMIHTKDNLGEGSVLLGISWSTLASKLCKVFGTKKLYALNKAKEIGWP